MTYSQPYIRSCRARRITALIVVAACGLTSCLGPSRLAPQIDALSGALAYEKALQLMAESNGGYGQNNRLQFLLDRGMLQHMSRDYAASKESFAAAHVLADELYTTSLSKEAATWLLNDYAAPYGGEDFERVFINLFQALNFAMMGERESALVEARDVDGVLSVINDQYAPEHKNVYKEDAFIRLIMGILYEGAGTTMDQNDAYVSYAKSAEIYARDYSENYGVPMPIILQKNLLRTARVIDRAAFSRYRDQFEGISVTGTREQRQGAEVYVLHYNGLSPIKEEAHITIPLPDGYWVKAAFPAYRKRSYTTASSRLLATSSETGAVTVGDSELVQPVGAIAEKNLERRKLRFIAKSSLRAAGRYALEKKQASRVEKTSGPISASLFRLFSSIFNVMIEKADVRCWQTLPDEIRLSHVFLAPGTYTLVMESFDGHGAHLGNVSLDERSFREGEQVFLIVHTTR